MSRIINPDSAGKERIHLTKAIVVAVRELARQSSPGPESRDLTAFIILALEAVAQTIDISVAAWEKRGYWVKADKFRMEWTWATPSSEKLQKFLSSGDWEGVARVATQIALHLNKITVSVNHRMGHPWVGAWDKLRSR